MIKRSMYIKGSVQQLALFIYYKKYMCKFSLVSLFFFSLCFMAAR